MKSNKSFKVITNRSISTKNRLKFKRAGSNHLLVKKSRNLKRSRNKFIYISKCYGKS